MKSCGFADNMVLDDGENSKELPVFGILMVVSEKQKFIGTRLMGSEEER